MKMQSLNKTFEEYVAELVALRQKEGLTFKQIVQKCAFAGLTSGEVVTIIKLLFCEYGIEKP